MTQMITEMITTTKIVIPYPAADMRNANFVSIILSPFQNFLFNHLLPKEGHVYEKDKAR